jgi:hypothetical protein
MKLVLSSQDRVDAITVDAGDQPPSELWHSVVTTDRFQESLRSAVRDLLAGTRRPEWVSTLLKAGVIARDGPYANLVVWLVQSPEHDAHRNALDYTATVARSASQANHRAAGLVLKLAPFEQLQRHDRLRTKRLENGTPREGPSAPTLPSRLTSHFSSLANKRSPQTAVVLSLAGERACPHGKSRVCSQP